MTSSLFPSLLLSSLNRMREDNASTFLDSIIASPNVPTIVVRRTSTMLINQSISLQGSTPDVLAIRRILSSIQQRHPSTLHEVVEEISQSDNASKDLVEQLIISLSMVGIHSSLAVNIAPIFPIELRHPRPELKWAKQ